MAGCFRAWRETRTVAAGTAVRGRFVAGEARKSSAWDLLVAITSRDLRVKYHGTFLSYFWWIARPLTLGIVLYFALNRVLKLDVPNHAVFLLSALFPWFWFQSAMHSSTGVFIGNAGLLKKVSFPRIILPLSVVAGSTFEFLVTLPVLAIFVLINGINADWTWLIGIPVLVALQFALLAGLGIAAATINVFFRDLAPALDSVLTLLFYVSPIIYPLDQVPDKMKPVLLLNPMVPLIEAWRDLFLYGDLPSWDIWPSVVLTAVAIAAGLLILRAAERDLADAL
jgi:ABC-type polysaccharide/polyol phosphate export permease